jgi:hypothetical protein
MSCTTITKAKSINPCGDTLVIGVVDPAAQVGSVVFTNLATGRTQIEAAELDVTTVSCDLPSDLASGNAYEVSVIGTDGSTLPFGTFPNGTEVLAVVVPVQKVFGSNGQVDEPVQDIRLVQ